MRDGPNRLVQQRAHHTLRPRVSGGVGGGGADYKTLFCESWREINSKRVPVSS